MEFEQLDIFSYSNEEDELENLTERQKKTYNLIKKNSLLGRITTIRDIVDNYSIEFYKDGYSWDRRNESHNPCPAVWQDINRINNDNDIHEVIIWTNSYEYKLAEDAKEVKSFCKELYWKRAMAKLGRYSNLMRKVSRDGQYRLFKTKENAREYWQTFMTEHLDDLANMSIEEEETDF